MEDQAMSWPGLDAALQELGMLSTITSSRKEYLREKLERQRLSLAGGSMGSEGGSSRSSERPLQPSQAWNMPGIVSSSEAGALGWSPTLPDTENNENTFKFDATRLKTLVPARLGDVHQSMVQNPLHSIGLELDLSDGCVRRSCPARLAQLSAASHRQHHLKPYNIPWRREERVRTKSENADGDGPVGEVSDALPSISTVITALPPPPTPLFRSRSLEDVRSPPADVEELDEMSREIQRLHVNE